MIELEELEKIFRCWDNGKCPNPFCEYQKICRLFDKAYERGIDEMIRTVMLDD